MLVPLVILSIGAVAAGFLFKGSFIASETGGAFWNGALVFNEHLMHAMHEVPAWVKYSPFVAMLIGLATAYLMYMRSKDAPQRLAASLEPLYKFLLNKWYFDELYNAIFVKPAFALGRLFWQVGDVGIIDRFGPNGLAAVVARSSGAASKFQSGYVYSYALVMLLGLVALISWVMVR